MKLLGRPYDNIRKRRWQYSWEFKKKTWVKEDWGHIDPMVPDQGLRLFWVGRATKSYVLFRLNSSSCCFICYLSIPLPFVFLMFWLLSVGPLFPTYTFSYCATNRNVACSIPDDDIGIFRWHNLSVRTMTLWSTLSLTEMSTRRISWGKCCQCVRLTNIPTSCSVVMKSGNLKFLETSGPLQACNGSALPITYSFSSENKKKASTATQHSFIQYLRTRVSASLLSSSI